MWLLISFFVLAIIGILRYKVFYNPLTIFNGIWFIAFFLYFIFVSESSFYLSRNANIGFGLMMLGFNISYMFFSLVFYVSKKKRMIKKGNRIIKLKFIKVLFNIWLSITFIEIIYSRGVPMFWKFAGINKSYAQFGIPSLHGFVNSLSWVVLIFAFYSFLNVEMTKKNRKKMMKIIITIIITYLFLLARQSLMTAFVQMLGVYLLTKQVNYKNVFLSIIYSIILFGLAGNFRSGSEHFKMVAKVPEKFPDFLLGFYWVIMYIATSVDNMYSLLDSYFSFNYGLISLKSLLPTVISNLLKIKSVPIVGYFNNPAFNTSTFLNVPYIDFSFMGIIFVSVVYALIGNMSWRSYLNKKNDAETVFIYAIVFQILVMSFFVNMLLMLPIVIQFIYVKLFLGTRCFTISQKIEVA